LALQRDNLWYKDAVIYQLHVRTFYDSNADGVGDFPGLIQKLDYLQQLGITAIWLLPYYPSPLRDDGYDIADYTSVNPTYGSLEEFKTSLNAAHTRGIRVIIELVLNHTSVFLGVAIANFLSRTALLAAVNAGHPSARILVWSIRFVIWILAITMTLEELGLARQTVISAFSILFGATMLGLAIAFGLGGQDLARKALERYFGDAKKDREKDKEPQPL
jgi:alpha amylase-like protein